MSQQEKLYKDRNLQIIFATTLVMVLGVSSIAPAFPRIVEELHISRTQVGMLIVALTLPSTVLTPFWGILADRVGRKQILVPCLFLFGLAGGACAASKDFDTLIFLRVIQGIGGAGLGGISLAIIGDLFSGERRAEAMGLTGSMMSVGTASYPLIGGALATLGWNYPFLLTLAALPVGLIVLLFLHSPKTKSSENLGEYLTGAWSYLKNIRAIGAFMAGIIGFALLFGGYLTYFSLHMGTSFNAPPFIIGGIISSMSISTALVSSQLGRLVKIISVVNLVKLGFVLCAISLASIPFISRLELLLIPPILYGIGFAIIFPSLQAYVAGLAPSQYRAVFMSLNSLMFRTGQTLGPVIIGLAYVYGDFRGAFFFGAGLALATTLIGIIGGKIIR